MSKARKRKHVHRSIAHLQVPEDAAQAQRDVETRSAAVRAVSHVVTQLALTADAHGGALEHRVLPTLFAALDDYTTDNRCGDVDVL